MIVMVRRYFRIQAESKQVTLVFIYLSKLGARRMRQLCLWVIPCTVTLGSVESEGPFGGRAHVFRVQPCRGLSGGLVRGLSSILVI